MAEYTPVIPGSTYTSTTSADVTAGDVLVVSGDDTVAGASGASAAFAGIAGHDAKSGEKVTVHNGGVHILTSSGTVNAGDVVTTAASAKVAALGNTTYSQVIGIAVKGAASNKTKVRLFR